MAAEFLDGLGETLSKTAKGIGEKAEHFYSQQKLRNKVSGEKRIVDKVLADLGNILYKRYADGAELDDEMRVLCEQIDQHMEQIAEYKAEIARAKGRKLCPACQSEIDREAAFCPNCGASCPVPEPEEDIADAAAEETEVPAEEESAEAETLEEAQPAEESAGEEIPEEAQPAEESAGDAEQQA